MITLLLISYFLGDKMSWPVMSLIAATLGLLWLYRRHIKKKRLNGLKEIPGPRGLPLVGNLHQLGAVPGHAFRKWAETYGDIYQVKLGKFQTIVISDPKLCQEIFSSDPAYSSGRMHVPEFDLYEEQPGLGIFNSEGERWEVHNQFLLRQFGKSSMEALILDEVKELLQMFAKKAGKPVTRIRDTLRLAVINSLWMVMASQRYSSAFLKKVGSGYSHDDPKWLKMANNSSKAFSDVITKGRSILIYLPWVKKIFPNWSGYNSLRRALKENRLIFEQTVREHKQNFREDDLRDIIHVYLAEMGKAGENKESMFYGKTAERQLVVTLFDMVIGGSDATATTIAWSILYLCKWLEVQRKLQQEIDLVTSGKRLLSLDDRPNMPYTQAIIDEVLRFSSLVPVDGVQHRAMADSEFHGYFIPKDAIIQPNLYFIHQSPKFWEDPENFRPERFLKEDGKGYVRNSNLLPLQLGRRSCAGETLAMDTLFLYLTNIFQRFSIAFSLDEKEPGLESDLGFLRAPLPFSVIMTERVATAKL